MWNISWIPHRLLLKSASDFRMTLAIDACSKPFACFTDPALFAKSSFTFCYFKANFPGTVLKPGSNRRVGVASRLYPEFFFGFGEFFHGKLKIVPGMGSGNLRSDPRCAFRYNRV